MTVVWLVYPSEALSFCFYLPEEQPLLYAWICNQMKTLYTEPLMGEHTPRGSQSYDGRFRGLSYLFMPRLNFKRQTSNVTTLRLAIHEIESNSRLLSRSSFI